MHSLHHPPLRVEAVARVRSSNVYRFTASRTSRRAGHRGGRLSASCSSTSRAEQVPLDPLPFPASLTSLISPTTEKAITLLREFCCADCSSRLRGSIHPHAPAHSDPHVHGYHHLRLRADAPSFAPFNPLFCSSLLLPPRLSSAVSLLMLCISDVADIRITITYPYPYPCLCFHIQPPFRLSS